MHLKEKGALLSRSLSYEGVEFETVQASGEAAHTAAYNRSAAFFQKLLCELQLALSKSSPAEGGLFTLREKDEEVSDHKQLKVNVLQQSCYTVNNVLLRCERTPWP